jgi:hypothetical protein
VALPKSREALTRVPKRPRSEGSTLVKEVNPLQRPRDSMRPGTYREAFIMATRWTISPLGQTFSGTRRLSQDSAEQDTVLRCRHRTTGRLEWGCTKDQLMVVVQVSLLMPTPFTYY